MIEIRKFFECIIYPLFPKICFSCKKPLEYNINSIFCENCFTKIKFIERLVCQKCGLPLPDGGAHCYNCKTKDKKRKWWLEYIRSSVMVMS